MKKILLLTTGGTIACTGGGAGYAPTLDGSALLSYVPEVRGLADIELTGILNIDSSNMQPEDWELIAKTIRDAEDRYDGIVIVHGTDTMAYTSSAVSFMTLGLRKCVVFTGAQIPISKEGSDGRENLLDAVCTACSSGLTGVYVVFGGKIMPGCCVSKCDTEARAAFQCVNRREVGCVHQGKLRIFEYPSAPAGRPEWHIRVDNRVLLWKVTPGLSPDLLDACIEARYKIIILEAFGVGGLPMLRNSFLPKIIEWRERGILTVVTSQCHRGRCDMTIYETGRLALNQGAVCAGNMTREALLTKLMWILSITEDTDEIIALLRQNCCGEFGL
ncbi:asparaginase [Oscillibacter hominis]|uniref:asparaginase n=1 Tax=Oscillibacter hominis TaxID=2763056 RepID=A0A7G9B2Y3_9FIRM|nr:asparaginase [Oscillibacter hominis]QNL43914.1 asparaginase [Oscillibacter hominis]